MVKSYVRTAGFSSADSPRDGETNQATCDDEDDAEDDDNSSLVACPVASFGKLVCGFPNLDGGDSSHFED